jgi:outer membrane biosynthesis protein TonB
MSLWEQLLSRKVLVFWLRLLAVSFLLHSSILLFLFVSRKEKISFNISTTHMLFNCPVKVNQLKKTVSRGVSKPAAKSKKTAVPKPVVKKPEANILETKKTEVKKVEPVKQVAKPVKKTEEVKLPKKDIKPDAKPNSKVDSTSSAAEEVEIGRKDFENLKLFEKVHSTVSKNFKPPKGIAKGVECVIKLSLDKKGNLQNIEFEKSSNVLIFDLSAKRAALEAKMPKELWGKDIALNFKAD